MTTEPAERWGDDGEPAVTTPWHVSPTIAAYHAEDPVPLYAQRHAAPVTAVKAIEEELSYTYTSAWQRERVAAPAEWGMRGWLNRRLRFHLSAAAGERTHRAALSTIRGSFPAHRTVCVANPKGGAGKTPAAMLIAEMFATERREASVVGDLNPLRGTLGIRAGVQDPPYTIMDVLQHQEWLQRPGSSVGDLARFLRRQESGALVLASSEHAGEMRSLTTEHCQVVRDLLMARYSTFVLDTGNNEGDATWQFAVGTADVLVVPMRASRDHLWVAARMMAGLHARPRMQQLTRTAIAVVTDPDGNRFRLEDERWLSEHFAAVLYVPPDPAIAEGPLRLDRLSVPSRTAWTLVAAAVAEACARPSVHDRIPSQASI
jgi:MinD-like ATPase involved in chromosome partitioning or flagellar assembly